jgi:hypothetical protein
MRFVTPKQAFPPGYRDDLPARSEYPRPAPGAPPGAALGAAPGVEIDEAGTVVTRFEEDEAEAREAAREGLGVRRRQLEEELRSLTQDTREDNIMQEKDIIRGTPLRSVRRLRQVDWEFRQFELRREIAALARREARAAVEARAARRASSCSRLRKVLQGADHRGRFVYQNGWLSVTHRRVACKEADPYWGLARAAQHGGDGSRALHNSGLTVFGALLLLCAVMALSARLIPTSV